MESFQPPPQPPMLTQRRCDASDGGACTPVSPATVGYTRDTQSKVEHSQGKCKACVSMGTILRCTKRRITLKIATNTDISFEEK